jgi:hypothetical protein
MALRFCYLVIEPMDRLMSPFPLLWSSVSVVLAGVENEDHDRHGPPVTCQAVTNDLSAEGPAPVRQPEVSGKKM